MKFTLPISIQCETALQRPLVLTQLAPTDTIADLRAYITRYLDCGAGDAMRDVRLQIYDKNRAVIRPATLAAENSIALSGISRVDVSIGLLATSADMRPPTALNPWSMGPDDIYDPDRALVISPVVCLPGVVPVPSPRINHEYQASQWVESLHHRARMPAHTAYQPFHRDQLEYFLHEIYTLSKMKGFVQ